MIETAVISNIETLRLQVKALAGAGLVLSLLTILLGVVLFIMCRQYARVSRRLIRMENRLWERFGENF